MNTKIFLFYSLELTSYLLTFDAAAGDVMGGALANIDQLLKLPTGCGEQNMLKFAPNIYVLEYLTQSQQLTPAIEQKAHSFMQTGYSVALLQSSRILSIFVLLACICRIKHAHKLLKHVTDFSVTTVQRLKVLVG